MIDRIVFVQRIPLNETLLRVYPIDYLGENGVRVAYWDLSALFGLSRGGNAVERAYSKRFAAWGDLAASAKAEGRRTVFVMGFAYAPDTWRAWRIFSRSSAMLAEVDMGRIPEIKANFFRRARENLILLTDPSKVAHFILKRLFLASKRALGIRGPEIVFAAGSAALESAKGTRAVAIHHCDYDLDLLAHNDARLLDKRYAVFLDEYMPFHPDLEVVGIRRRVEPVRYYSSLIALFDRLESKYDIEVVIAAHPKADYSQSNPFGNRRIFIRKTCQLVRGCEFALTTFSNSLNYAVLERRPILFFTSEDIAAKYRSIRLDLYPSRYARVLGRPLVNLDHLADADLEIPPVDPLLYNAFRYRYIVSQESEGRISRDIWLQSLTKGVLGRRWADD